MEQQLEAKLIECLVALEQQPLDEVLARYPDDREKLRPLLETALALSRLRPEPSPDARGRSRAEMLAAAQAMRRAPALHRPRPGRLHAPLLELLALVLILFGVGLILVAISGSALPGSTLYGVKLGVENARLVLASDDTAREALAARFDQERRDEVRALLESGREAQVRFNGTIETIQPAAWIVSALPVQITPDTLVQGEPAIGRRAVVEGRTADGLLLASAITVEGEPVPPRPAIQPTAQRTSSPSPPTVAPTQTATQPPTSTPASTAIPPTASPAPTAGPTSPPPPPPTEGPGGENGNDNDNEGHAGDDNDDHGSGDNDNSDDD